MYCADQRPDINDSSLMPNRRSADLIIVISLVFSGVYKDSALLQAIVLIHLMLDCRKESLDKDGKVIYII